MQLNKQLLLEQGLETQYSCVDDKIADCFHCGDSASEIWDLMDYLSGLYPEWNAGWVIYKFENDLSTVEDFIRQEE